MKIIKSLILLNEIISKIPSAKIETTPMKFQDARNYQVSSEKLLKESGFQGRS